MRGKTMDKIEKLLSPELKNTVITEIKKNVFPEQPDPDHEDIASLAAEMLIKIYVHGYKKGYEQAQSEGFNGK